MCNLPFEAWRQIQDRITFAVSQMMALSLSGKNLGSLLRENPPPPKKPLTTAPEPHVKTLCGV